eukprot:m.383105 g.383105  ORF g.383105 m.383105 type:complete len:114 (-) comp20045_c7_seq66:4368-4709(-)
MPSTRAIKHDKQCPLLVCSCLRVTTSSQQRDGCSICSLEGCSPASPRRSRLAAIVNAVERVIHHTPRSLCHATVPGLFNSQLLSVSFVFQVSLSVCPSLGASPAQSVLLMHGP